MASSLSMSPQNLLRHARDLKVLHVNDSAVTILVDASSSNAVPSDANTRSLWKLTVASSHCQQVGPSIGCTSLDQLNAYSSSRSDTASCERARRFLQRLEFCLTIESGAEYSYYDAFSATTNWLDYISSLFSQQQNATTGRCFQLELIHPVSDRQIARSLPAPSAALIEETPTLYQTVVEPYIETVVKSGSLAWIENVVNGTKEAERLLLDAPDFILNIDTKWKSHPDPLAVAREEWKSHAATVADLYCLAIVKDGSRLRSLRDLHGDVDLPMLRNILEQGRAMIETVYGVAQDQLRVFFHYHPQFYHLHVHFTRLENENGCQVERGHLLSDVIQNLELDPEYYAKRTMTYKLKVNSELYKSMQESLSD